MKNDLGPDHDALSWDKIHLNATGARHRIRFASASELYRARAVHAGRPFSDLAVTMTVIGERERSAPLGLVYRYVPLEARGRPVSLPTDEDIIRNVAAGRGVLVRRPGGYALRGYQAQVIVRQNVVM